MPFHMGLISVPAAVGNKSYTGVGGKPKALLFFNQYNTAADESIMYGATDGVNEWVVWYAANTSSTAYLRKHDARDNRCLLSYLNSADTTLQWAATIVSLDADGFTLNWTDRTGASSQIVYIAFYGNEVEDAFCGTVLAGSAVGTVDVTDPGFKPNTGIFVHCKDAAFNLGQINYRQAGVGFVGADLAQYAQYTVGLPAETGLPDSYAQHREDAVSCCVDGADTFRMSLSQWRSDGFRLSIDDAWTANILHGYLVLKLQNSKAGASLSPVAIGTTSQSGFGFEPSFLLATWPGVNDQGQGRVSDEYVRSGLGGGIVGSALDVTGQFPNRTNFFVFTSNGWLENGFVVSMRGPTGTTFNTTAVTRAQINSFDVDGFTWNWTTSDGDQRSVGWLALSDQGPPEIFIPQFFRRVRPG